MTVPAPFRSSPIAVEQAWIDYNGHLNMAYYNVIFDRGADQALAELGLGPDYAVNRRLTIYTAEAHVCYVRELHLGDLVTVTFQLVDHDAKRLHAYQEILHSDGWLAATCETISLHVDMQGPRVAPFPEDSLARVESLAREHSVLSRPDRVGRSVGIRRA
jgi:acyl-CoA thioester hydrolase